MRTNRAILLLASATLVVLLLGGGFAMRVGAAEGSYRQAVLFAEVLDLVMDNYVDPVQAEKLLRGAYEGMLGGLDPNGAYLTADEVTEWKAAPGDDSADPGMIVLKAGRSLQVVAVRPASAAAEAGIVVGDQVRGVNGIPVRDLSLAQSRRLLRGAPGSSVELTVLRSDDSFRSEDVELTRGTPSGATHQVRVDRGTAIVKIQEPARIDGEELATELAELESNGVDRLLLDLRNASAGDPRAVSEAAGIFSGKASLRLRDPSGRLLESVHTTRQDPVWTGTIHVLVNGATAGAAEALTLLVREGRDADVYGESTYGLGAEVSLYEFEDGSGLLVSSSRWETGSGDFWNEKGVEPDNEVHGEGTDLAEIYEDQLDRVLALLDGSPRDEADDAIEPPAGS